MKFKHMRKFFGLDNANSSESTNNTATTSTVTVDQFHVKGTTDWYTQDIETLTTYETACNTFLNSIGANGTLCSNPLNTYQTAISGVNTAVINEVSDYLGDVNAQYGWSFLSYSKYQLTKGAGVYAAKAFLAADRVGAANFALSDDPVIPQSFIYCASNYSSGNFSSDAACMNYGYSLHHNLTSSLAPPINHFNRNMNSADTALPHFMIIGTAAVAIAGYNTISGFFNTFSGFFNSSAVESEKVENNSECVKSIETEKEENLLDALLGNSNIMINQMKVDQTSAFPEETDQVRTQFRYSSGPV